MFSFKAIFHSALAEVPWELWHMQMSGRCLGPAQAQRGLPEACALMLIFSFTKTLSLLSFQPLIPVESGFDY